MAQDFYDKVAKKFGNYSNPAKYIQEFTSGAPEEIFRQKLIELGGKDKIALDSGCGDGRFTLEISKYFKKIIGNDTSRLMLNAALNLQKEKGVKNVEFIEKRTDNLDYPNSYFDVIYARRAVTNYPMFFKMLKSGGYALAIEIGEKDTQEIEEVFGRGQNFGGFDSPRLKNEKVKIEKVGFNVLYAEDFHYNEYYLSYNDLDTFLQGVPIFEDFDSEKDKKHLQEYVNKFQTEKGIRLSRHRYIIVAQK